MQVCDLLTHEDRWYQGCCYIDVEGDQIEMQDWHTIDDSSPESVFETVGKMCLAGAIRLCYPDQYDQKLQLVSADLGRPACFWQDEGRRTFEEVQDLVYRLRL